MGIQFRQLRLSTTICLATIAGCSPVPKPAYQTKAIATTSGLTQKQWRAIERELIHLSYLPQRTNKDSPNGILITNSKLYQGGKRILGRLRQNHILVSTYKLSNMKLATVVKHEVLHSWGLGHCKQKNCVMYDKPRRKSLCTTCKARLRR